MPKPLRKEGKAISEKMEERPTGRTESAGLMNTIDNSLDDMRSIITCRVCVRPLYEPFTIECGHTFCYTCLVSWFEKNAGNKTCPDCRAKITRTPAPAYLIREITQLFSNRAELLPAGETTQEHQDQQREEAKVLEKDRHGRGLFRGCFRNGARRERRRDIGIGNHIIIDDEDGVNRCPRCTWEVEDGECAGCGWPGEAESWDDDSVISLVSAEGMLMYHGMDMDGSSTGPARVSELDHADTSSNQDASSESDDMGDSDDESVGSLNEFVVQDDGGEGDRHGSRLTRRNLEWRFPRRASRGRDPPESTDASPNTLFGRTPNPRVQSETDGESPDSSSASGSSLGEESHTDELSQLSRLGYVDNAGNLRYGLRPFSDLIRQNPAVVHISDDEDIVPFTPRARNRRTLRPDRGITISESDSRSPLPQVLEVSSDSDEPIVPHRTRRSMNSRPTGNNASARPTGFLRSILSSDDDADVDDEDSGHRRLHQQVSEHEPSLIEVGDSEDTHMSHSLDNERPSRSRLDPTTSIPIRRENVNMPGAFPPSFVSEQGQSQSTPVVHFQGLNSPPSPSENSSTRERHQSHVSAFLDRRRHEERTYTMPGDQPRRRDRSAAKSARRQDRQRVKATQEARGRSNGEPSVPPSTVS